MAMTDALQSKNDVLGLPADVLVVDVDTHWTEPHDLWSARADSAPASLRDRLPKVERVGGRPKWMCDGVEIGGASSGCVIDSNEEKSLGMQFLTWEMEDMHPGAYDMQSRVDAMDKLGVWAQIIYPNGPGFGGQNFGQIDDFALRRAVVELYNDAGAELQSTSGDRLFPMAMVPWWDVDFAVAEVKRCAEMGMRGVNSSSGPHTHGLPDLSEAHWDPLWDACAEYSMPVNFHIGAAADTMAWFGTSPWPSHNMEKKLAIGSSMMYLSNATVIANLIFGGVCERHPDVQFVSVESGVGWIPFFLQSLDYQKTQVQPKFVDDLSLTPTEYFQRQMYACFWFEDQGVAEALAVLGDDRLMFETDFPHPTCLYPDSLSGAANLMQSLSSETRSKVLSTNAANLYNLPLPT